MHDDRPFDDHVEDPLEALPEGPDPLLDDKANAMATQTRDAVTGIARLPDEPDDEYAQRRNRQIDQAVHGAARDTWNTLPHGTPGGCLPRLVVTVHEDGDVSPRLKAALRHAVRLCPGTRLVMFVLTAPHPSWRAAWLAFRQEYARQCPQVALRVEVLGHPRLCFFDAWGRPVSAASESVSGIYQWWRDAGPGQKELFRRRVRLLERLGVAQWATCAYKRLHTGQPGGDFQDLSFGAYRTRSKRILKWSARIYLDDPQLPTGFPMQLLRTPVGPHGIVRGNDQDGQPGQPWCPEDMRALENHPATFINATALIDRLP